MIWTRKTQHRGTRRKFALLILLIALVSIDWCFALPTLGYWHWRPLSLQSRIDNKLPPKKKSWFQSVIHNVTSGTVTAGPRVIHHTLYWLTAADAIQSIFRNQYTDLMGAMARRNTENAMVPVVYSRLFYFARMRPRLLYAVGALLRALQLCTPLGRILDPSIGVGAGINLCAIVASSRWIKPLILGWATTKYAWKWLGAQRVQRAYLPITLSIHEWEGQKAKKGTKNLID